MEFTEKQKNYLADVYANGKSSSDVFREQHKADFIAGFEKALSLFAVSGRSEQLPTDIEIGKAVSDLANIADNEMER